MRIAGAPKCASTPVVSCTPPVRPSTSGIPPDSSPRQPIHHPCFGAFRQAPAPAPSRPLLKDDGALHGGLQNRRIRRGRRHPPRGWPARCGCLRGGISSSISITGGDPALAVGKNDPSWRGLRGISPHSDTGHLPSRLPDFSSLDAKAICRYWTRCRYSRCELRRHHGLQDTTRG